MESADREGVGGQPVRDDEDGPESSRAGQRGLPRQGGLVGADRRDRRLELASLDDGALAEVIEQVAGRRRPGDGPRDLPGPRARRGLCRPVQEHGGRPRRSGEPALARRLIPHHCTDGLRRSAVDRPAVVERPLMPRPGRERPAGLTRGASAGRTRLGLAIGARQQTRRVRRRHKRDHRVDGLAGLPYTWPRAGRGGAPGRTRFAASGRYVHAGRRVPSRQDHRVLNTS